MNCNMYINKLMSNSVLIINTILSVINNTCKCLLLIMWKKKKNWNFFLKNRPDWSIIYSLGGQFSISISESSNKFIL